MTAKTYAARLLLPLLLLVAPLAHADGDALDTVLDILYKAGVIDGNVKAAKPLISCLADGKNVADCTAGAADQSEFAADPQVKNVIDIYQAFRAQDYYTVLKKAGITVGCALIPGGEIKDVACGELGKIAMAALDGVGSVLGAVGSFVTSIVGGGSDPPPMSPQDYYTLNFMPWYHWSVVFQLDNDTPANYQVLNAPVPACVDYFYHHTYSKDDANKVCGDMRTWLNNAGYAIGNAFRDETDSYFQLHFAPKIDEWAVMSFNKPGTIDSLANGAMANCLINERKKIPLPEPGFEQCDAINPNAGGALFVQVLQQLKNQCVALATQRTVPKDNDAYTRICTPITNRVSGKIILAMGEVKTRMEAAAAAGCPNDGTPKSIHCDSVAAHSECVNAIPEHASMCQLTSQGILDTAAAAGCPNSGTVQSIYCSNKPAWDACVQALAEQKALCQFDYIAAARANAQLIFEAATTADSPCELNDRTISCVRTIQQTRCESTKQEIFKVNAWQLIGVQCAPLESPAYNQLREQAQQVLAAINADYPAPGLHLQSLAQVRAAPPPAPCGLARHDPLVISCAEDFHLEAIPERAAAVYAAINADNQGGRPRPTYCLADVDNDGAETPCLDGQARESPETTPRPLLIRQAAPAIDNGGQ